MDKYVFIYDFLMKDLENKEYGMDDFYTVGCLYDYDRFGYNFIIPSRRVRSCVVGDIFKLDDKLEALLDRFYSRFGYTKTVENVLMINDNKEIDCVVYYLEEEEEMIPKSEMDKLGSSEPFVYMKECYDITEKEFKEFYKKNKSEIHHILPANTEFFKEEIDLLRKENPKSKILMSGFAVVVRE